MMSELETASPTVTLKKLPPQCLKLQFAGDMVLLRKPEPQYMRLVARFQSLFEHLANLERTERLLLYRMLNGLMLTSHARKCPDKEKKRHYFDLKNNIFSSIAQNKNLAKLVEFRYLTTPKKLVRKYCDNCAAENKAADIKPHQYKSCEKCDVDPDFFNILSMQVKFPQGQIRLFISNEHARQLLDLKTIKKFDLRRVEEEAQFKNYHYNVTNLDAIALESVLAMYQKFGVQ